MHRVTVDEYGSSLIFQAGNSARQEGGEKGVRDDSQSCPKKMFSGLATKAIFLQLSTPFFTTWTKERYVYLTVKLLFYGGGLFKSLILVASADLSLEKQNPRGYFFSLKKNPLICPPGNMIIFFYWRKEQTEKIASSQTWMWWNGCHLRSNGWCRYYHWLPSSLTFLSSPKSTMSNFDSEEWNHLNNWEKSPRRRFKLYVKHPQGNGLERAVL